MTDVEYIGASDNKMTEETVIEDVVYGMSLSTRVGGYAAFSDLVLEIPHDEISEDSNIDYLNKLCVIACNKSYLFQTEVLQDALTACLAGASCSQEHSLFCHYMLDDLKQINSPWVYLQLI